MGFYSPAGDEETSVLLLAKLRDMLKARPADFVRELLPHVESRSAPGVRQSLALGTIYLSLMERASNPADYDRAVAYFSRARRHAPGLPAALQIVRIASAPAGP